MAKAVMIKVKLVKSLIGIPERQKRIAKSLGLRKMNKVKYHKDNPAIKGMILKINHLVNVERVKK